MNVFPCKTPVATPRTATMTTSKAAYDWAALPHSAIEKLDPNLWRVEGSLPNMPLRRVMTVARLENEELIIYNAIALDEPEMKELEAWGTPAYLVIPNAWHKLDAARFATRYPEAKVIAPSAQRAKVLGVVPRAAGPEQLAMNSEVTIREFEGTGGRELYMTVRSGSHITLILADAVFNMPHGKGMQGFVLRHVTQSSGGPRVSRVGRLLLVKDRTAFAAQLRSLATDDLKRVIVAHHETISEKPAQALLRVADSLAT